MNDLTAKIFADPSAQKLEDLYAALDTTTMKNLENDPNLSLHIYVIDDVAFGKGRDNTPQGGGSPQQSYNRYSGSGSQYASRRSPAGYGDDDDDADAPLFHSTRSSSSGWGDPYGTAGRRSASPSSVSSRTSSRSSLMDYDDDTSSFATTVDEYGGGGGGQWGSSVRGRRDSAGSDYAYGGRDSWQPEKTLRQPPTNRRSNFNRDHVPMKFYAEPATFAKLDLTNVQRTENVSKLVAEIIDVLSSTNSLR